MPSPAFGGSLGHKINWSRVNLTSTTWFAGTLQRWRSTCGQRYLPERRSGSKYLPHHYTPARYKTEVILETFFPASVLGRYWKKTTKLTKNTKSEWSGVTQKHTEIQTEPLKQKKTNLILTERKFNICSHLCAPVVHSCWHNTACQSNIPAGKPGQIIELAS